MSEKTFDTMEMAFRYVVKKLISINHAYIINILGPLEHAANQATTVQVVAQELIFEDGECGLTLHLPFDFESGTSQEFIRFLGTDFSTVCDKCDFDGIPCFALRFGTDVPTAVEVTRYLLGEVYGYKRPTTFQCTVYDQGKVDA